MPAKAEVRPSAGRCQITQDFVARKEGEDLVMELDWLRARLAAIEEAEAAEARQREASGLAAAEAEQDAADDALELLEERLLTTPARSLADLAAKAHTLHRQRDAFDEMEPRHVDALLADILALAEDLP